MVGERWDLGGPEARVREVRVGWTGLQYSSLISELRPDRPGFGGNTNQAPPAVKFGSSLLAVMVEQIDDFSVRLQKVRGARPPALSKHPQRHPSACASLMCATHRTRTAVRTRLQRTHILHKHTTSPLYAPSHRLTIHIPKHIPSVRAPFKPRPLRPPPPSSSPPLWPPPRLPSLAS